MTATALAITNARMFQIKRMWEGAPLRQFAAARPHRSWGVPHAGDGYVGQYVCEFCLHAVIGVYLACNFAGMTKQAWVCAACRYRDQSRQRGNGSEPELDAKLNRAPERSARRLTRQEQ
jgi:hypothetical protein